MRTKYQGKPILADEDAANRDNKIFGSAESEEVKKGPKYALSLRPAPLWTRQVTRCYVRSTVLFL
jgi:hypothetical protein